VSWRVTTGSPSSLLFRLNKNKFFSGDNGGKRPRSCFLGGAMSCNCRSSPSPEYFLRVEVICVSNYVTTTTTLDLHGCRIDCSQAAGGKSAAVSFRTAQYRGRAGYARHDARYHQ